ncbi:MORN repeat-containing protein [Leptolyngbyaceae cyanobacterium UHCC 1019]
MRSCSKPYIQSAHQGMVLAIVSTLFGLSNIAPVYAKYGYLELKDADENIWRCEGQFQGNSGQGICVNQSEKAVGEPYKYYRGQIRNRTFDGNGTLVYDNDDRYQGQMKNGRPNGKGVFLAVAENRRYEGTFRNGEFHGRGTYSFANGDRYVGQFAGGQPHGIGKFSFFKDGKVSYSYNGQFYLGVINGKGVVTNADGTVCNGVFFNNTLSGKGTCTFPRESTFQSYTGELYNGRPNGRGTVIYANGKRYTGEFREGKPGLSKDGGS